MNEKYKGIIIKESLTNLSILEEVEVISERTELDQDNPDEKWHLYTIEVLRGVIDKLQTHLKRKGGWYMHFWRGRDVIVVFRDKMFEINYNDKSTWEEAIDYGLSMGVPRKQLDFLID